MEATKAGERRVPMSSPRVAFDFLLLAAAAIMAGLITAAVAAALVILLSASANAAARSSTELAVPDTARIQDIDYLSASSRREGTRIENT
ncbi:MAG TPA: hypothetical protein VGO08_22125 [Burkholderiales bacterium]|jgi:hypothetical protein|nr:hypothetical protein [Burkholderiales bacterium]